jgi:glycolate oxidase FAD binding subunit
MTAAAPDRALVAQRLREELSWLSLSAPTSAHEVDGLAPSVVARPGSADEVARALQVACAVGAGVIPRGGGTQTALGMPPGRYDLALDLTGLDRVLEYEPADLTVTVEAGMPLAALQAHLGERGQWLPLDPPVTPAATIGGVLAVNASGPARIAFGTARDLVIGMTVAMADGRIVKFGGRVVKNVAGYDLSKLHIGALGTLGVILQASFKVAPQPKALHTLTVASADAGSLMRLAFAVRDASLPATGIALSRPAGASEARLLLRFAGSAAAVERSLLETGRMARAEGLDAEQAPDGAWREAAEVRALGGATVIRVSDRPSRSGEAIARLSALGGDVLSYPTAGASYGRVIALSEASYEAVRTLRTAVEAGGGASVVESAPVAAKGAIGVWGRPRGGDTMMRRLKQEMDPQSTLNSGRLEQGI